MGVKRFTSFLNENFMKIKMSDKIIRAFEKLKENNITEVKSEFEEALDGYKDLIIDLLDNNHPNEIDIAYQIQILEEKVSPEILREMNLLEFLRMINNIIKIPKRSITKKIESVFYEYYSTLDERFDRLMKIITKNKPSGYFDKVDGDKSVLSREEYEEELEELQIQLNRLQRWVVEKKKKVVIVFEGRDAAGKGSCIKRFIQYMPTGGYRVVAKGIPNKDELDGNNWFKRYESDMPSEGEIVFFDRSWYGMALVNPTMGYCTEEQYRYFMDNVNKFEEDLAKQDIKLIKFWFSITKEKQLQRFDIRKQSELKYWKFSPNDMKSINKWDLFTKFKEQCFQITSTSKNPWVIVNSNDKKLSRLNTIRYFLGKFSYKGKESDLEPYPEIIYELK